MSPRRAVTVVLLAFVAASVAYLAFGGARRGAADAGAPAGAAAEPRVVAYYFHVTARCPTCLAIEDGARRAIESGFAAEIGSGDMAFRSVDIEEPANEHFGAEFGITASSLVLVRSENGQVTRWANLERVWDLVGDDALFAAYVVENARDFLAPS